MVTGFRGALEVITSGLISSTFPFMTPRPERAGKLSKVTQQRTKDACGFSPAPASVPAPPTPGHLEAEAAQAGEGERGGVSN